MGVDRESWWPLVVGVVVSLAAHLLGLPVLQTMAGRGAARDTSRTSEAAKDDRIKVGQSDAMVSSVAWISHADFRELLARKSAVEQPALQRDVDPVENADIPVDPTDTEQAIAQAAPAVAADGKNNAAGGEPVRTSAVPIPVVPPTRAAHAQASNASTGEPAHTNPSDGLADQAADQSAERSKGPLVSGGASSPPNDANPTSAARADAESPPVSLIGGTLKVRPGRVAVGEGIEIRPIRPRFSVVTSVSAVPDNPRARITFDGQGRVVHVVMRRSTGYADIDGPVEASLYKWRAAGPRLAELPEGFAIDVDLILVE